MLHYNFNANVHQSCFREKFIADENILMSKLGVSFKNMNLFYRTVMLWSSSYIIIIIIIIIIFTNIFKLNCLNPTLSATHGPRRHTKTRTECRKPCRDTIFVDPPVHNKGLVWDWHPLYNYTTCQNKFIQRSFINCVHDKSIPVTTAWQSSGWEWRRRPAYKKGSGTKLTW
jgi:hypothetical protein